MIVYHVPKPSKYRVNLIYRNPCHKTFLTFVVECCIFAVLSQLVTCVVTLRKVLRETNCRFSSMLFPASSNAQAIQAAKGELGKDSSYGKMGFQVSKCGVQKNALTSTFSPNISDLSQSHWAFVEGEQEKSTLG